MELCFIWVSAFRNIRTQGFNLSSKYLCRYDQELNSLDIRDNPNYLPDFFGDYVTNVTGIVGENASGKTNLLELVNYLMDGGNTRVAAPFLIVFEDKESFKVQVYQLDPPNCERPVETEKYSGGQKLMEAVYFTNTFDGRRHEFGKNVYDLSTNRLLQNNFGENFQTNLKKEVQGQIRFLQSDVFKAIQALDGAALDIRPAHVQFISPIWDNIYSRARNFDKLVSEIIGEKFSDLSKFCRNFRKKITASDNVRSFIYFTGFLLFLDFLSNEFMPEANGKRRPPDLPQLKAELAQINLYELKNERINAIFEAITGRIADFIDKKYPHTFNKTKFLKELDQYAFPTLEKLSEGTYSSKRFEFRSEMTPEVERFIRKYSEATTQLNLNYTIEWLGISAGQKAFLTLFSRLYSIFREVKEASLLITIDEGDLYFHPRWQVEYLARLLRILPLIFPGKKLQLVLTTHSPFLVSDLTRSHLLFLRKNGQYCEVIPTSEIDLETFGGNIGELYLNAFFLDGSLISHFAAEKIRKLLERIKNDQSKNSAFDNLLIAQLGDQLIQFQLKKLRDDKN